MNGETYRYDSFNRLESAGGMTYVVNPEGQRLRKSGTLGTTDFAPDQSGLLLAEHPDSGWVDYVYLGGRLIGRIAANKVDAVATDQVGRPEAVTNPSKSIIWQAQNHAFNRTVTTDGITLNLGFPGQYYDAETGLWYNGFRDYDARLGRYVESDPSGLKGGLNTYAYVEDDPVDSYDFYGLQDVGSNIAESLQPLNPGYPLTYGEYLDQCKSNKYVKNQEEKNKELIACIAKSYGMDAAQAVGADLLVGAVSEIGGPEVGVPLTVAYAYLKGSKAVKIISTASGVKNVANCVLKTQ